MLTRSEYHHKSSYYPRPCATWQVQLMRCTADGIQSWQSTGLRIRTMHAQVDKSLKNCKSAKAKNLPSRRNRNTRLESKSNQRLSQHDGQSKSNRLKILPNISQGAAWFRQHPRHASTIASVQTRHINFKTAWRSRDGAEQRRRPHRNALRQYSADRVFK